VIFHAFRFYLFLFFYFSDFLTGILQTIPAGIIVEILFSLLVFYLSAA